MAPGAWHAVGIAHAGHLDRSTHGRCAHCRRCGQTCPCNVTGQPAHRPQRGPAEAPPPALEPGDARSERGDRRYAHLAPGQVPLTECLKDTVARVLPFWDGVLAPAIRSGQRIVVAAHGNSIRAMVKMLDGISDADIVNLNIPNGIPLVYELDADLKPIRSHYLGDPAAAAAAAAVANQGKKG